MDILKDPYLILAKKLSWFFGFWNVTQTFGERVIRNYIVGFTLLYLILAQLCQFLTMDFNLRSIVSILQLFIPIVCTTNGYCAFILQVMTVHDIFSGIVQDCQELKDETELKIMKKYINECKLFVVICGILFYVFVTSAIFPFILRIIASTTELMSNTDRNLIFGCSNDFLKEEYYYYPVIIFEILSAILTATVAMVCFSLYFWFIQHACARLCIIKSKIRRLFENDQHQGNVLEKPLDLSDWTIDIIQCFSRTRKFMTLVNKFSEKSYLFQMLLALVLVVLDFLCLFEIPILLQNKENKNNIIAFLIFIVYTLFPLYLNCFVGQRLIDYSIDAYEEMCLIPVYNITLKTQKLLLTSLMMNAKPCSISIGKMFVSSHEFFSDLLRMALSFAIILHSIQNV